MERFFCNTITLYHQNEDCETYQRAVIGGVSVFYRDGTSQSKDGETSACAAVIRILCADDINIHPGDWVVFGVCKEEIPDCNIRRRIRQVTDNRRGPKILWHWRLDVE